MKRFLACAAIAAVAGLAGSASADVTITLPVGGATFTGFQFSEVFPPGTLSGTLTAVAIDVTLTDSVAFTYADDLTIYLDEVPLSAGGLLQVGGFSNLSAAERQFWPNGASDVIGTTSIGSVTLTTPIDMGTTTASVFIGNGYGDPGASGTWTGTLTLIGVDIVPAPATASLLGLGGLVALRRRRSR